MSDCYQVRVKPTTSTSHDGVTIYDTNGKPWNGGFYSATVLCFVEDKNTDASYVKGFRPSLDTKNGCGADSNFCKIVSSSTPDALSVSVSPGKCCGDYLLLNAEANNVVYQAVNNPPGIDGGRPIIRNPFELTALVTVVVGAAVIFYVAWRKFNGLPLLMGRQKDRH